MAASVGRWLLRPACQGRALKHSRCHLSLTRGPAAYRSSGVVPAQAPRVRSRSGSLRTFAAATDDLVKQIKDKNDQNPVLIYAKSYCPYCSQVRGLFSKIDVDYKAINLDEVQEGDQILDGLMGITQRKTVPQVFIKSEFIGGCDDTVGMLDSGELKKKLEAAGISSNL